MMKKLVEKLKAFNGHCAASEALAKEITSELRDLLQDRRPNVVSESTGLHVNTIIKLKKGRTENPSPDVLRALVEYFVK